MIPSFNEFYLPNDMPAKYSIYEISQILKSKNIILINALLRKTPLINHDLEYGKILDAYQEEIKRREKKREISEVKREVDDFLSVVDLLSTCKIYGNVIKNARFKEEFHKFPKYLFALTNHPILYKVNDHKEEIFPILTEGEYLAAVKMFNESPFTESISFKKGRVQRLHSPISREECNHSYMHFYCSYCYSLEFDPDDKNRQEKMSFNYRVCCECKSVTLIPLEDCGPSHFTNDESIYESLTDSPFVGRCSICDFDICKCGASDTYQEYH